MKPILDFDDAGADDLELAKGVLIGHIREWHGELERLKLENWQLKQACGYPIPADKETPQNPFKCGVCDARARYREIANNYPLCMVKEYGGNWCVVRCIHSDECRASPVERQAISLFR